MNAEILFYVIETINMAALLLCGFYAIEFAKEKMRGTLHRPTELRVNFIAMVTFALISFTLFVVMYQVMMRGKPPLPR